MRVTDDAMDYLVSQIIDDCPDTAFDYALELAGNDETAAWALMDTASWKATER